MSDLVAAARRGAAAVPDLPLLGRVLDAGCDPVLYTGYRDLVPPGRPDLAIKADLVAYAGGPLPDGQPGRSIGHWNTPGQIEIFQVLTGRVLMATAHHDGHELRFRHQIAAAGDLMAVPAGHWHLTLVLEQSPALVFNIYLDPHDHRPSMPSAGRTAAFGPKYAPGPHRVPALALAASSQRSAVHVADDTARRSQSTPPLTWLNAIIGRDLASWMRQATAERVDLLHSDFARWSRTMTTTSPGADAAPGPQ
jgi:hypothetical protein